MDAKKRRGVNILDDIVEEILVKVPVRSLVRFKAVSKQWKGTIESKWFADKQVRSQKSLGGGQARIVRIVPRCFGRKTRRTRLTLENLLLMPPNGLVYTSPYQLIRHPRPRLRLRLRRYKISEPCDGLFCIYTKDRELILVNPATNSSRILPDPNPDPYPSTLPEDVWRRQITLVGIGRENVANNIPRYKLVCFFKADNEMVNKSTRCKVFALDSNTWRYVDPPNRQVYYDHPIIHVDGVLYCFGYNNMEECFIAFDLHTETFQSYSVTPDVGSRDLHELSMCALNHRLCIFRSAPNINREDLFFKVWGLDIKKGSLEIMYSIEYSCLPPEVDHMTMVPVATLNNYLILSNRSHTFWVFYGSKTHIFLGNHSSGFLEYVVLQGHIQTNTISL